MACSCRPLEQPIAEVSGGRFAGGVIRDPALLLCELTQRAVNSSLSGVPNRIPEIEGLPVQEGRQNLVSGARRIKKIPKGLKPLIEDGIIDEVHCQLQSGKEATVYVVSSEGEIFCAKVYKDSDRRSFQRVVEYTEGRTSRGSRNKRAMAKGSRYGRKVQEAHWKDAESEALFKLVEAGVRVPMPQGVYEGVLLMELVLDADGYPAPRLNEVDMTEELALEWHAFMMTQIVRMLCADVIHGDLSEFNVLVAPEGPVVIDVPQAVAATGNNHAFKMLARDVNNMQSTFGHFAPQLLDTQYARELWELHETGELKPDTVLTGVHVRNEARADVDAVLDQIEEARLEAEAREAAYYEAWDDKPRRIIPGEYEEG